jgi:hypothetical protein
MEVYRGGVLALKVQSIGEAAKLTVDEAGPRFVRHDAARLVRLKERLAGTGVSPLFMRETDEEALG